MATYAVGDVQGCYDALRRLLDQIRFDPGSDRLWFVGDLVNRGPDSLAVLRFIKALGDRAVVVLGNHDLHLLARAEGQTRNAKKDNLDDILNAPDRDDLLTWLRHRPLMHHDAAKRFTMVHAGLPPQWDLPLALACAHELETALRGPDYRDFLSGMYGNEPAIWSPDLTGTERLRFITNCLTRMRYCDPMGRLDLSAKGHPGTQATATTATLPWFRIPWRATRTERIVFGHWSTLKWLAEDNVWSLDTGCLWGGHLTAIRIRKKKEIERFEVECPTYRRPKDTPSC
jgi:bis(5'-nucleosyl)-tetraphosphatase (symmetrical)